MRRVFVKERSAYTTEGLAQLFGVSSGLAIKLIAKLSARGVLRLRSGSDEEEFDEHESSYYRGKYQFVYVGLVIVGESYEDQKATLTIVVYPKYMDERSFASQAPNDEAMNKVRQVFRVLRKSARRYTATISLTEETDQFHDYFVCMMMLLEMYEEYGIYSNYVRTLQTNGNGDISWERTIAMHHPYIQGNTPIYFEYETTKNTKDDADFITRLHKSILTECSQTLEEFGVSEIFGIDPILLSDESVSDLGEDAQLLYRLDRERNIQFVTWKQDVIDLMKRFISKDDSSAGFERIICLGTTTFYHLWEDACKIAIGDKLNVPLNRLGISLSADWANERNMRLIDIIPRPQWFALTGDVEETCGRVDTLIPDTIGLWDVNSSQRVFGIFDAKYYVPILGKRVRGVPGVESVTKQILYQRAYKQFVIDHGFNRVVNAFLVPGDDGRFEPIGRVDFPGVFEREEPPLQNGVVMWRLPASDIWQCYLADKRLDGNALNQLYETIAGTA